MFCHVHMCLQHSGSYPRRPIQISNTNAHQLDYPYKFFTLTLILRVMSNKSSIKNRSHVQVSASSSETPSETLIFMRISGGRIRLKHSNAPEHLCQNLCHLGRPCRGFVPRRCHVVPRRAATAGIGRVLGPGERNLVDALMRLRRRPRGSGSGCSGTSSYPKAIWTRWRVALHSGFGGDE